MARIIFIKENDQDIAGLMQYILEEAGYGVLLSTTSETVLSQLRKAKPDLVFLGHSLCDTTLVNECNAIKACRETADIPVVITSTDPALDHLQQLTGANDKLQKPFDITELEAKAAKWI